MIEFKQVAKEFMNSGNRIQALDQVTLTIQDQEIFGLVGESGAGKSTLLRFINALERPTSGQVVVDDVSVNELSAKELRTFRKDISMVFQQFNLLNNKTVAENVALPLSLHKYDNPLTVDEVLGFVGLADKGNHYPSQLSGGQKQRVGIARALITRPKFLLADEPTSALDTRTTGEIVKVLKAAYDAYPMTMIVVTHELEVIKALCQRAAILENGQVSQVLAVQSDIQAVSDNSQSYAQQVLEVLAGHE
ncbi:metal ABC transporter ATP-binding protein [Aerococcus urinaeequi]|uniref:Metal ABC transporter ATP-binding protein n=1 Tax=Aerococcus urinaeequi TaxID=51665 RepID=A0AAC8X139_9LACT|nr:ATP-binding cassette domain-containing protein [Aerococcus urinaeequi]ALZ88275.1 metal ABC transporter ATP-binding protein [Aerococcus urinaeequi]AMB97941.1 metal ABC transporter ATP-binding protein [Aerococcus urinaeequi]